MEILSFATRVVSLSFRKVSADKRKKWMLAVVTASRRFPRVVVQNEDAIGEIEKKERRLRFYRCGVVEVNFAEPAEIWDTSSSNTFPRGHGSVRCESRVRFRACATGKQMHFPGRDVSPVRIST